MKKTLQVVIIFLCPLFAVSKGFVLSGAIDGLQTGSVSLAYINQDGEDTTINAAIVNGIFRLTGQAAEPELTRLTVTEGWSFNTSFYLENSDITVHLIKDDPDKVTIAGSVSNVVYEKLTPGLSDFFAHARANEAAHQQAAATHNNLEKLSADSLWFAQQHQWIENIRKTITGNADNYAALYFIRWLLFRPDNYDDIFSVFMDLSPAVRNGPSGKKLYADFEHLHKTLPGQPAPDIRGNDTSGHAVTLASFKGQVILLDFWSSYCGPCRQENRRMVSVYQKYHPLGFEVVSYSLDNDRRMWLQAIVTDGMIWPQASDLRGGAGATPGVYDITDLPRNVLIDRSGKIYAKDIHGQDLTEAMERLLGKGK